MKKLAVFVEGQTEQIFFKKFITEMAGARNVALSLQGLCTDRVVNLRGESSVDENSKFFVLIYDCQCDGKVKSKIIESRERLIGAGYDVVFGLLDLYPRPLSDLADFRRGLAKYLPTAGIDIRLHVAVTEVEAWFLQDATHYTKIHADLTNEKVVEASGFDPRQQSSEELVHPAETLRDIYKSVGRGYDKSRRHVQRTVDSLDFEYLCLQASPLIPSFSSLCADVDAFLEP
ncbi:DUF4276 family protein [Stenotrophomonas rhizophila]|uniref:DUF4276 family protein n=1 Tax=Stenotrophomonas rhizophila TaxID=216778 RepID=UPI0028AFFD79|nr:DUF4276 family protein [Stenotrophomonas rhizophila]